MFGDIFLLRSWLFWDLTRICSSFSDWLARRCSLFAKPLSIQIRSSERRSMNHWRTRRLKFRSTESLKQIDRMMKKGRVGVTKKEREKERGELTFNVDYRTRIDIETKSIFELIVKQRREEKEREQQRRKLSFALRREDISLLSFDRSRRKGRAKLWVWLVLVNGIDAMTMRRVSIR